MQDGGRIAGAQHIIMSFTAVAALQYVVPQDTDALYINLSACCGQDTSAEDSAEAGDGDTTDTDDEFEAMDDHAKAQIRAMARKWLKSRKNQLNILDAAYNRYTFNDDGLPRWFRDDEAKHMRPMTGATRDELQAERELLRAIDARPLKKVRARRLNAGAGWVYVMRGTRGHTA